MLRMTKKEIGKLILFGNIGLFSILFLGCSITFMSLTDDIILVLLFALMSFGWLCLFHSFFKIIPFEKIKIVKEKKNDEN